MAHEGAHGVMGSLSGRKVHGIKLESSADGETRVELIKGPGRVVFYFVGYAITWLLLLSGVRQVVQHGVQAVDAGKLRTMTGLPRLLWVCLWLAGSLAAVAVGGRPLVMHP
jgi:Peptidase M50B-like